MSDKAQLARLAHLAGMIREQRLELLRHAAERKTKTEQLIAGLDQPGTTALPTIPAARAELAYQGWADQRRRELAAVLAAQTLECERKRDAARLAFGRAQVLDRLKAGKK